MSDSCLFQLEHHYNTNPYREFGMKNRHFVPRSAHSHRSTIPIESFFANQKTPLTLDRLAYKLRIKSDLNVDFFREYHHREPCHTNSPTTEPRPTPRKPPYRQATATTRTSNVTVPRKIHGIEGNAVHVGTLNDLIKHFRREEIRLIRQNDDSIDNLSTHTSNNRSTMTSERPLAFAAERSMKQARALTEYHFPDRQPSEISRHSKPQLNSKRTGRVLLTSRKPIPPSNKLTILDPFSSKNIPALVPSNGYIFPRMRAFGYYTRKTPEEILAYPSPLFRRRTDMKRIPRNSLESLGQLSTITDERSQVLTDLEDDLCNPPNTRINADYKGKK